MQYKVPQNIDQEDKILGPLTFVQFIYVLIGGGLVLFFFSIFDFGLFLLTAIPVIILTICFALIKVQDQPFSKFFISLLIYLRQPKRRTWHDLDKELKAEPQSLGPEAKNQAIEAVTAEAVTAPNPVWDTPINPPREAAPAPSPRKVPIQVIGGGNG